MITNLLLAVALIGNPVGTCEKFKRGDINEDGQVDMTDCISFSNCLYNLECGKNDDAGDVNDDGIIDLSDWIYLCQWAADSSNPPPPPPYDEEGYDPTSDDTGGCDVEPITIQPTDLVFDDCSGTNTNWDQFDCSDLGGGPHWQSRNIPGTCDHGDSFLSDMVATWNVINNAGPPVSARAVGNDLLFLDYVVQATFSANVFNECGGSILCPAQGELGFDLEDIVMTLTFTHEASQADIDVSLNLFTDEGIPPTHENLTYNWTVDENCDITFGGTQPDGFGSEVFNDEDLDELMGNSIPGQLADGLCTAVASAGLEETDTVRLTKVTISGLSAYYRIFQTRDVFSAEWLDTFVLRPQIATRESE